MCGEGGAGGQFIGWQVDMGEESSLQGGAGPMALFAMAYHEL